MKNTLHLYVWEDVLCDYTSGVMFALAHSVDEARELLRKRCDWLPETDLMGDPVIYDDKMAYYVWGGS